MNNLYEVLEICLQDIEKGEEIESVLFRYPDLADDLRPILETSVGARNMAIPMTSEEVIRRNRAKVLEHAAQMRERKTTSSPRGWIAPLRRLAVTLVVATLLFVSGTSLVDAAANTLPGDDLYPIKRTWESLSLLLTFDSHQREVIEIEHENERMHELQQLLAEGRSEEVDFTGVVTSQQGNEWVVHPGVIVVLTDQTEVRDGPIKVGSAVRVRGETQANGVILAERIRLLESDGHLPAISGQPELGSEDNEGPSQPGEDNSGPGSGGETPEVRKTAEPDGKSREESIEGVVASIENNTLVVNGIEMDISRAEIRGIPRIGLSVKVEGYYDAKGVFIVTRIEFKDEDSGGGDFNNSNENSGPGGSDGNENGSNDNSNDDNGNNGNDNGGDANSGGDDSGGGGDNSGSGGGGDDGDNSGPGGGGGND